MASGPCGWPPLLLPLLLLLVAAGAVRAAGRLSSAAEDGGRYRPFLDRLLPGHGVPARYPETSGLDSRRLPSREPQFDLLPLDGRHEELLAPDRHRYDVEPIEDDWVQLGAGRGSAEEEYEPVWRGEEPLGDEPVWRGEEPMEDEPAWRGAEPLGDEPAWRGAEPLEDEPAWRGAESLGDDWPPLRTPQEEEDVWPRGPLRDSDEGDWVKIGGPEDGAWAEGKEASRWQQPGWSKRRDQAGPADLDRAQPGWTSLSRSDDPSEPEDPSDPSDSYSESDEESDQESEQAERRQSQRQERPAADLAAELALSRPDSAAPDGDTARQLHAIRHAFLQQAEAAPDGQQAPQVPQQAPRAAALSAAPSGHRLNMRKRLAAGGGGSGGGGRQRYMPWLLIAGIAVGTVATVLGAIFVARRVKGGPGRVVTQQWIPHHVLRMSTGSADIQPTAGATRQADPAAEPIRIKAKGLLERRCSNSSLTIQLQQAEDDGEPIVVTSPATHSEAAEYLASAGNRLSRRELRQTEESVAALQAEFWDIPLNFPDRGDIVGASTKNRYKTVMPNEHTRVTLPGVNEDPLSSYINANWIRGYDSEERAYIATQGPLAHTLEDFWQMVLSRRAPAVVMITKLRENGRIKCAGYLPETRQKATFGKIEVTVKRILPRSGYTLRQVTVKRGKEQLQLQHFWFTAWPDHRTPDDSQQLLQMSTEVEAARRDSEGNPTGPVVVHCSAGIGRTGCFIAVSVGTSQLMEEGGVDVLGIVCSMRRDRGGMVQTAEQYIFIHRALRDFEASLPALEAPTRPAN